MARSCGIRIGPRRFELVVLDGSAKRSKMPTWRAGVFPVEEGVDPFDAAVDTLRSVVKELNIPRENVGIAVDTSRAAFRRITLPFADRAKIEQVLKYEVESELPQWNIDDVIVDFLVLNSSAVESSLIVTAIPKDDLSSQLDICQRAGFEPLEAELESSAMVNAAEAAGLFDPESACVLVHFGDTSTSVAIVDGGELKSMRAIHTGAFPAGGAEPSATHSSDVAARLKRELLRAISGAQTTQNVEAVYICGYDAVGLAGEEIGDVPVEMLQLVPGAEEETGVEAPARLFVAWGAAYRQLGGGMLKPSLRREELRFLGKFERLELPLAVLGLLLLTFFSVRTIITFKDLRQREANLAIWVEANNIYMMGDPKQGYRGSLKSPSEDMKTYTASTKAGTATEDSYAQLQKIERIIDTEILDVQRSLGRDASIEPPRSAFEGLTLVLGVLKEMDESLGQFTVSRLDANYNKGTSARSSKGERITIKMDLTFRGSGSVEATQRYESFMATVREKPWYVDDKPVGQLVLDDGKGIFLKGLQFEVDPKKATTEPAS